MENIGESAGKSFPAKSRVCAPLNMARAIPIAISIVLATPNVAKAAVTVIPGTSNSTMSAPTARIFSQYGPGQDELAEERSTTPGRFDMFIGSSIVDSHFSVVKMLISAEDCADGGTLSIPFHVSLEGIPSDDTDTAITARAELMCSVDGGAAVTLTQLGESMQLGFMDGLHPIDKKSTGNYFVNLSPGPHDVKFIAFLNSDWSDSTFKGEVRPEFVSNNVPESSSLSLLIGAGLLAGRRRRNPTETANTSEEV